MHKDSLTALLRCIRCTSPLATSSASPTLECPRCGASYPVVAGVPVMLDPDRSLFDPAGVKDPGLASPPDLKRRIVRLVFDHLPGLEANLASERSFRRIIGTLRPNARVLVVGGGRDGFGFHVVRGRTDLLVVASDITLDRDTDLVCDGHQLPFEDGSFDCVVLQAVLEHVLDPRQCVAEAHRVLARDGLVYAETPFIQEVHLAPYDFQRFTDLGHRWLFKEFEEIDRGPACGAGSALAWTLTYFLQSFASARHARTVLHVLGRLLFFPLKYFDYLGAKGTYDAAAGFYFLGRKTDYSLSKAELLTQYRGVS